ncbi:MAG: PIN domain-containing protein [Burkholderiaceae bacterium]|jgi:hypothetical protein|nr:PIN domain-containing protein [Burkholderiaceae bacterium]
MHLLIDLENVQPTAHAVDVWMGVAGTAWIFHSPQQQKLLSAFEALGDRVTLVPISRPGPNSLDFHLVFYLGYLASRNAASKYVLLSKDRGYDPVIKHAKLLGFSLRRVSALESAPIVSDSNTTDSAPAAKPTQKPRAKKAGTPKKVAARKDAQTKKTVKAIGAVGVNQPRHIPTAPATKPLTALAPKKKRKAAKLVISIYRDVRADLGAPNRPRKLKALERHIQSRIGPESAPEKVQAVIDRLKTSDAIRVVGDRLVYGT